MRPRWGWATAFDHMGSRESGCGLVWHRSWCFQCVRPMTYGLRCRTWVTSLAHVPSTTQSNQTTPTSPPDLDLDLCPAPCPQLALAPTNPQLPIYPQEVDTVTLVVSPNPLVEHITTAREAASGVVGQARSVVESGVSRWIGLERSVEREWVGAVSRVGVGSARLPCRAGVRAGA